MDWDMIVRYDCMMETDSASLPAQATMTLYQEDGHSWPTSSEHHVHCKWIHPECHQLKVATLGTEPVGPTYQEYGVKLQVANRVALIWEHRIFSSGTSAHPRVCEKSWTAQDPAWKKHWGPHQGSMWIHSSRADIPRAVAKIRKNCSEALFVVPMGSTEEERT